MNHTNGLEELFVQHGYSDYKWIKTENIIVSQWVRMKCMYGCPDYGRNASCPPNVPSVAECRQFFNDYTTAAIFHFEKSLERPEDRAAWSKQVNQNLLKLEKEVFLKGYQKVFLLFMDCCRICTDCPGNRTECKSAKLAHPSPESMAVDVFSTVETVEKVISDSRKTSRFGILKVSTKSRGAYATLQSL